MRQDPARMLAAMLAIPEAVDPEVRAWWVEQARVAPSPSLTGRALFDQPEAVARLRELLDAGLTTPELAREFGVSESTVSRARRRIGRPAAPRRAPPEGEA